MKIKQLFLSLASVLLLGLVACKKEVVEVPTSLARENSINLFPLELGNSWTYQVKETTWRLGEADSSEFELKWTISDTIRTAANDVAYVLLEERKASGSDFFSDTFARNLALEQTPFELLFSEENIDYVLLAYPVSKETTWDPFEYTGSNRQGPFKPLNESIYQNLGENFSVLDTVYSDTYRVTRDSINALTEFELNYEVYAEGVGMIYSIFHRLDTFSIDPVTGLRVPFEGEKTVYQLTSTN